MKREPLVSIIITNYNYERYLDAAINSALHQSYTKTEVIVVDDGSRDHSREVIARYGGRIRPILKPNGGQPSAFNAGFAQSHGEIVIFLDADDVLLPDTARRVAESFCADPHAAKMQYRMEVIDATGMPTGEIKPPRYLPMLSGDLRRHVLTFPDDLTWMATSGNAFSAAVLRKISPVPERKDGHGADWYLAMVSPLFGPVISFDWIGAYYRVHSSNFYTSSTLDLNRIRLAIELMSYIHRFIGQYAKQLGLGGFPSNPNDVRSVAFLGYRLVSVKLDPAHHPIRDEKTWSLFWQGIEATLHRFDVSLPLKVVYLLWFSVMVLAPRPVAHWLAEKFFFPEARGQFNWVLGAFHGTIRPPPIITRA